MQRDGELYVHESGAGPALVFVHGSAADADTWGLQRAALSPTHRVITYDRRGTARSPLGAEVAAYGVAEHAADAMALIERRAAAPAIAVGSSFGAVVVLELARRYPHLLAGAVLCEPPLAAADDAAPVPAAFRDEFDRRYREDGGEAAAELFLRTVLGDASFERIPAPWRARALAMHRQIALDVAAVLDYQPRFSTLGSLSTPFLLLGGGRSAAYFPPVLDALEEALPRVSRRTLPDAGHLMHAEDARGFNAALAEFAASTRDRLA